MSIQPDERISFVLSNLSREDKRTRRRATPEEFASAAAVAGACTESDDIEVANDTRVDAKRKLPKLRPNRMFCSTLVGMWTFFTLLGSGSLIFQLKSNRFFETKDPVVERRITRDETIVDRLVFGIWDSKHSSTPMQLQVSVSMALGVRANDGDIEIKVEDNFFYEIYIEHATSEEVDYISTDTFLTRLNQQLSYYEGFAVLSKPPKLLKVNKT